MLLFLARLRAVDGGTGRKPWHRKGRRAADCCTAVGLHQDSGGMQCRVLAWYPAAEYRAMPEVAVLNSRDTTVWPSCGLATMTSSSIVNMWVSPRASPLRRFRNGCNGCNGQNLMGK